MDRPTLKALLKEAIRERDGAARAFSKYDNADDMRLEESWRHAVDWIQDKINSI